MVLCMIGKRAKAQNAGTRWTPLLKACELIQPLYFNPVQFRLYLRGINRVTRNIDLALLIVDDAFRYVVLSLYHPASRNLYRISDAEAVAMARYLVKNDGLFLGSSSACNLVACIKLIKQMGWSENRTIVTVL